MSPTPQPALLVLEDGTAFRGDAVGAVGTAFGEAVFNTSLTGYQEVLTDPSYHRQIVTMTYPHQGNYGVTEEDAESSRVRAAGFVAREVSRRTSNHRAQGDLDGYLRRAGVVGISEVDTRRLVRHLRDAGAMRAAVSTEVLDADALQRQVAESLHMEGADLTGEVSAPAPYALPADGGDARFRVVALDFGLKRTSLRLLTHGGCDVEVLPSAATAGDVLEREPDGVWLSNGPGDPAAVRRGIATIEGLLRAEVPLFGICLGHQLLAEAVGARTYKLKFGHRGTNHPVQNVARRAVEITSQNHGFAVDATTLPEHGAFGRVVQTHVNLSDGTNEGLRCEDAPAFSVQYHPEAAPGPHDARYLFEEFGDLMRSRSPRHRTAGAR